MNREKLVVAAVVSLLTYTLALSFINSAYSPPPKNSKLSSGGGVRARGLLTIYSDAGCINIMVSIDWGLLDPGENKNVTCYVSNKDKSALILSFLTDNWNPLNALQYMTLSWDYGGQSINPGEVIEITFTLAVSENVPDITDFSFDIIIVGTDARAV